MASIKLLNYLDKLNEAYLCLHNTMLVVNDPSTKRRLLEEMLRGTPTLVEDLLRKQDINKDSAGFATARDLFLKGMTESNKKKIDNYSPILLNQNLVMLCTILEIFFIHVLETIIETNPNTLIGLSKEKEISLKAVIDLKDYEAIIRNFKDKTFDHFSRQSIKEQFEIYSKLGIDISKIFDYSMFTPEAQKEMAGNNLDKLIQIFETRHSIVHENALPIQTEDELYKILNFFNKVVLNLATVVMKKYKISLDVQEFMRPPENG